MAALSLKVRSASLAKLSASGSPTSDISTRLAPVGETSMTSRSPTASWVSPLRLTCTVDTGPLSPDTEIVDGYGFAWPRWSALPDAGTSIAVALVNVVGPSAWAGAAVSVTRGRDRGGQRPEEGGDVAS